MNSHLNILIDKTVEAHEAHRVQRVNKLIVTQSLNNWFLINEHQHIPMANGDIMQLNEHIIRVYIQNQYDLNSSGEIDDNPAWEDNLKFLNKQTNINQFPPASPTLPLLKMRNLA